jgi:hypothetical protein
MISYEHLNTMQLFKFSISRAVVDIIFLNSNSEDKRVHLLRRHDDTGSFQEMGIQWQWSVVIFSEPKNSYSGVGLKTRMEWRRVVV